MSERIKPFKIAVDQSQLDDLKQRLALTRWPEAETVDDWRQGVPLQAIQSLCGYWQHHYDWRRCETALNRFQHFTTPIDGLTIHFIHQRSPHPDAMPLILTHGWPGSIIEFLKVIGPLTDPVAHGGKAEDAFHVVIPSLPGFGFSEKPQKTGWNIPRIAECWITLMKRLGYTEFVAQGGDWGAGVTTAIGEIKPPECLGIHLNMPLVYPQTEDFANLNPREQAAVDKMQWYQDYDSGYSKQQSTRPQTLSYGLVDSPAAQAAWIYEKFYEWTDNNGTPEDTLSRDEMLDNIMLYWLPATAASSARLYWESFSHMSGSVLTLPVGVSIFPEELFRPTQAWAERVYSNIIHWNELDKGGHFAAFEQPEAFINEVRECFRQLR